MEEVSNFASNKFSSRHFTEFQVYEFYNLLYSKPLLNKRNFYKSSNYLAQTDAACSQVSLSFLAWAYFTPFAFRSHNSYAKSAQMRASRSCFPRDGKSYAIFRNFISALGTFVRSVKGCC